MQDLGGNIYLGQDALADDWVVLSQKERRRHLYVIGQTGTGKTTFLKSLFLQDAIKGRGASFIDPHGDAAKEIADALPKHRLDDVIFFDPSDEDFPLAINPFYKVPKQFRSLAVSSLLSCFKLQWGNSWGPRLEYILRHCLTALMEVPDECHHTLLSIQFMLTQDGFRKKILKHVHDPACLNFWQNEFGAWDKRYRNEAIAPILNKTGAYASHALLRGVIGQARSSFCFSKLMDESKLLIVNLSKGLLGDDGVSLLGSLIVSGLQQAAYRRAVMPEDQRIDHALYIDEFQSFSSPETFASIFSEARKYRLSLVVSHQFLQQLDDKVLDAVVGNVGTHAVFSVGHSDAQRLASDFNPYPAETLLTSGRGEFMLRTRRHGEVENPIRVRGINPNLKTGQYLKVRNQTRRRYASKFSRAEIEGMISQQFSPNPTSSFCALSRPAKSHRGGRLRRVRVS